MVIHFKMSSINKIIIWADPPSRLQIEQLLKQSKDNYNKNHRMLQLVGINKAPRAQMDLPAQGF